MNTNITSDLNNLTSLIKNERHRTRLILALPVLECVGV